MNENLKAWMVAALIRAIRTAAQTAASLIGLSAGVDQIDWLMVAQAAGLAALLSIITSLSGIPEVADGQSIKQLLED